MNLVGRLMIPRAYEFLMFFIFLLETIHRGDTFYFYHITQIVSKH